MILLLTLLGFLSSKNQAQTVTDIDGNVYNTVTIGSQVWLKENLKVTHYRNGDTIPNVVDNTAWSELTTGAYCNYGNNAGNSTEYGRLYNWFAVNDSRIISPVGWHIATDAEWTILTDFLDGEDVAGGKLKEMGTVHWASPNVGATNEVDFTALPGGYRANNEIYLGIHNIGSWWSASQSSSSEAWARGIFSDAINVDRGGYYEKKMGFSVRCVMDPSTGINDLPDLDKILVYPNPAKDRITIYCLGTQGTEVKIYNLIGEYILQQSMDKRTTEIDIHDLLKGLYIIKIESDNGIIQRKLFKL